MRILILVLLLANLGFWAWTHWIQTAPVPTGTYDGPTITLLRELPADSPLLASPDAAPLATPDFAGNRSTGDDSVPRCMLVGPFTQSDDADSATDLLAAEGVDSRRVAGEDEVWDGYWVYIERIDSRDTARAMLAELTDNGIDDAYVIPDSDSGILISLGVFSEISRAGTQAERVGRLGFEATIADRLRLAETTWLRMTPRAGIDVLALLQEPGRINRLERRDCDTAAD